jgi:plasmid maintenance system antidote protein VapI
MSNSKLLERLVTKFSIKVNDLARYLEISKATIYNYRNLEKFGQIPNDKQYKIFFLFGKENEQELWLLLDENDKQALTEYTGRITQIFAERAAAPKTLVGGKTLAEIEISHLTNIDELSKKVVLEKILVILSKLSNAEVKGFADYLEIFNTHIDGLHK